MTDNKEDNTKVESGTKSAPDIVAGTESKGDEEGADYPTTASAESTEPTTKDPKAVDDGEEGNTNVVSCTDPFVLDFATTNISSDSSASDTESSTQTARAYPDALKSVAFSGLPYVDLTDVKIIHQLGSNTKCGSGWLSEWNGQKIALKKYDDDSFHRFEREVANYMKLKEVWGRLIPTPYFVSCSNCKRYLGMQLARDPTPKDDTSTWQEDVINELERRFGFVHNSAHAYKHCKFLPGKDGEADTMIAIDLENHYWTDPAPCSL